jgi:hypothetical protein
LEYQVGTLLWGELKHEVLREPSEIAFHRLIEVGCGHSVETRKITVQHDPLSAYQKNNALDGLRRDNTALAYGPHHNGNSLARTEAHRQDWEMVCWRCVTELTESAYNGGKHFHGCSFTETMLNSLFSSRVPAGAAVKGVGDGQTDWSASCD